MGEVHMAIDSYKKAISLLDTAESLSDEERKEHPETTHPDNQDNQDMDVEPT